MAGARPVPCPLPPPLPARSRSSSHPETIPLAALPLPGDARRQRARSPPEAAGGRGWGGAGPRLGASLRCWARRRGAPADLGVSLAVKLPHEEMKEFKLQLQPADSSGNGPPKSCLGARVPSRSRSEERGRENKTDSHEQLSVTAHVVISGNVWSDIFRDQLFFLLFPSPLFLVNTGCRAHCR